MTREDAIEHIWGLTGQVSGEFCCTRAEEESLYDETAEALKALGCSAGEIDWP